MSVGSKSLLVIVASSTLAAWTGCGAPPGVRPAMATSDDSQRASVAPATIGDPLRAVQDKSDYPAEISGIGDTPNFPLEVAGYRRGNMLMYAPGMTDISFEYSRFDSALQNSVTVYFYPRVKPLIDEFAGVKQAVLQTHPGGTISSEKNVDLVKDGKTYHGMMASFRFRDVFSGTAQNLSSQVTVVEQASRFVKVRSTSPVAHSASAESGVSHLLDGVAWGEQ